MTEGAWGLLLRMSVFLLLLGLASFQLLSSWSSQQIQLGENISQNVLPDLMTKNPRRLKHKKLVVGRAAGQGHPGRHQCTDVQSNNGSITKTESTSRSLVPHRSCLRSSTETVLFVTLFASSISEAMNISSSFQKATARRKMDDDKLNAVLKIFLDSIEVSMPGSLVTVIIDPSKGLMKQEPRQGVEWKPIPGDYSSNNLMIQRLKSYIGFLEDMVINWNSSRNQPNTHVILTDFDMIVVDDIGCVFAEHPFFDVALTFRNNLKQPINSGVIMVRGSLGSLSRGVLLLEEVLEVYRAKFGYALGRLGDQLALGDVVGAPFKSNSFREGVPFEALVQSARTLFVPCAIYNWTPSEGAGQFQGMPDNVKVLHFKGSRKHLMVEAWRLYKQQVMPDFSHMKCLILKSGRNKYDY